jgi:DNA end-binding protein Ku
MATSVWKGHISFGLVAFPVKLHAAARSQAVSFNQLHQCRKGPLRGSRGPRVGPDGAAQFPGDGGAGVRACGGGRSGVPDASYYVVPEQAGEKLYTLLYEALRRSGYVSIAQLTMHSREHLVLLRPGRLGLLLHTLFYSDEVRTLDEFRTDTEWVAPQELELAHLLVESLAAPFEPAKYKDRYRENLRALIDAKIRGEELKLGAPPPVPSPVADILEALKASLERLKKPVVVSQQPPQPAPAPKAHPEGPCQLD